MDKDFLKSGVIMPAVVILAVGIIGLLFINGNIENISPFTNGEEILYFEELTPSDKVTDKKADELSGGELVGKINSASQMNLRYTAEYSSLATEASLSDKGVFPGETGTAYIQITNNNKDKIGTSLSFSGLFGGNYEKKEEFTVNNEDSVYRVSPRAKSSVVVFYQMRGDDYGISSKYRLIIYEEVE